MVSAGLALRLPGLLFNGMYDLEQTVLQWGASVAERGLGPSFGENYGFLSYLAYGAAAEIALEIPRFWWAPVKAMELGAEIGVLGVLLWLVPAAQRFTVLVLYWLNPWFILHGAWQGFWEGPHVLAALIGVACVARVQRRWLAWGGLGFLIATSWMFKPQGLIQLGVPIGIHLAVDLLRTGGARVFWFTGGALVFVVLGTAGLVADGAHWLAIPRNTLSASGSMPNLCNECLNLWHPVSTGLMLVLGQQGLTYHLVLPGAALAALHLLAAAVTLGAIVVFSWRLPAPEIAPPQWTLLLVMAFASLVVSSFGTMAHVNHGYTAAVLLVPFAAADRRIRRPWLLLIGISLLAHLTTFGVGRARVMPELYTDHPPARALIAAIEGAVGEARGLVLLQHRVQRFLHAWIPLEPTLTLLSLGHFGCAVWLVRELFRSAARGAGDAPPWPRRTQPDPAPAQ